MGIDTNASCIIVVILILLKPQYFLAARGESAANSQDDAVVPVANVSGLVARSARLPCDTRPPSPDNPLLLVIWFREPSPDPIYSFDVRGQGSEVGRHWNDGSLGARARFEEKAQPTPLLWIEDLRDDDEGTYRCRVDFKHAPTQNFKINLRVIVPPGRPVIYNERGILVETNLGPYNEGMELILTCSVSGGRPRPSLHWLSNERHVQSESYSSNLLADQEANEKRASSEDETSADVVTSTLVIGPVHRRDVDTTFTCLASNSNMTQASRASAVLQMNLLPLYVHIKTDKEPLSAERVYEVHCITYGSRPSALVTWWLGNTQLLDHSSQPSDGGNVTSSTLRFSPKVEDMGKVLRCRAENPVMPASQIEDTWTLDINYLPRVTLQLGSTLDPDNIKEGDDVYYECAINAKPKVYKIIWKFNGMDLRQDLRRGIIMGNQSLVLQSLGRNATGNYHCVATNAEGTTFSNPVHLDIKFRPVCGADQKMVYGVAHGEIASINCTVKANPTTDLRFRWTFNSSAELNTLPESRYTNQGPTSQLIYSLNTGRDYGTILCWAENSLGMQNEPCVFHLIPAVPPARPTSCRMDNLTSEALAPGLEAHDVIASNSDSLVVLCQAGFDGGLPQTFLLEVRRNGVDLVANQSVTSKPYFKVDGLAPDTTFTLDVYSMNAKGRSMPVRLSMHTRKQLAGGADVKYSISAESTLSEQGELKPLSTSPEHQESQSVSQKSGSASAESSSLQPIMSILGGVATALILVSVVIIVTMRMRCGTRELGSGANNHDHTWKTDSGENSSTDLQQRPSPDPMISSDASSNNTLSRRASANNPGKMTVIHHHRQMGRRSSDRLATLPLPPPPPPTLRPRISAPMFTSLTASTLPRNFWHHQQGMHIMPRPSSVMIRRPRLIQQSASMTSNEAAVQLPSPPDPPSSFALSALQSLDLPFAAQDLPSPPLDCDIVLPPPAESLYSLPRPHKANFLSSSAERLINVSEEELLKHHQQQMQHSGTRLTKVRFDTRQGDQQQQRRQFKPNMTTSIHSESVV